MANVNSVLLKQLFDMDILSIWKPNENELIIRVPGGWVFTVNKVPVYVPEPSSESAHSYMETMQNLLLKAVQKDDKEDEPDDTFEDIEEKLEEIQNEIKNKSIPSESVHCDGMCGECGQVDETTGEVRVCHEGASSTDTEAS